LIGKIFFYLAPFAAIYVLLPEMDLFSQTLIAFVVLHIFFQIGAILSISNEEILYSGKEKLLRILIVLFIPIIGILIEYFSAKKYSKKETDMDDNTTGFATYFTGINATRLDNGNDSGVGGSN
jgi:positive regulator of sigma E activity